jgi:dihydrofolate reductase
VTSTTPENTWTNASVLGGGLLDSVAALKERSGGDIGLHGSIALTQALLEGGLVDELSLVIAPALQGKGRKLFEKVLSTSLRLTGHVISPSGYLLLNYRVQPNS